MYTKRFSDDERTIYGYYYTAESGEHVKFPSEHVLQGVCVLWFKNNYPDKIIYAIPNGGARNVVVAKKMKNEGVVAGIPDLFVASMNNGFGGLYIEMKNGKTRVEQHQVQMHEKLRNEGFKCEVCRGYEEFKKIVYDYLK